MPSTQRAWPATALVAILTLLSAPLPAADDPCSAFTWDVSRELKLFAGPATALAAGADSAAAPSLAMERLYSLTLRPLNEVTFVAAPGKRNTAASGHAGLATLDIKAPGKYRFALDAPAWIDVIADGGAMNTSGHQGAAGCAGPHKIVEFEFSVARRVTLQFSGADMAALRLTVTPSR
jgi:hypothetical protein